MSVATLPIVTNPVIGRWLTWHRASRMRDQTQELQVRSLGTLTLISLRDDASAKQQRKRLLRTVSEIPVTQRSIVLDVSGIEDHDLGLHELIELVIALAARRHFGIVLAGVSNAKLAQLDLTRILNLVSCYQRTGDAIQALLCQRSSSEINSA